MELEKVIKEEFKTFVDSKFQNESIRSFLNNHERLPLMIGNLIKELKKCDTIILGSNKDLESKRDLIKNLVKDFANMFCSQALEVKAKELGHKSNMSFAKKIMTI